MDTYSVFSEADKTTVLGAKKAQLPFSEHRYPLLKSCHKIPFPVISVVGIFSCRIQTDEMLLAHTNIPLKGHKTI